MASFEIISNRYPSGGDSPQARLIFIDNNAGAFTFTVDVGDGTYPSDPSQIVAGSTVITGGGGGGPISASAVIDPNGIGVALEAIGALGNGQYLTFMGDSVSPRGANFVVTYGVAPANDTLDLSIDGGSASFTVDALGGIIARGPSRFSSTLRLDSSVLDSNNNTILSFTPTAAAVDFLTLVNGATGTPGQAKIQAAGSDTDISIWLQPKNSGSGTPGVVQIRNVGATGSPTLSFWNTVGGFEQLKLGGSTISAPNTGDVLAISSTGGTVRISDANSAGHFDVDANVLDVTFHQVVKFAGTNTTGGGSALLGSNSPAVTNTAPYTWIQIKTADGSTAFIPAWK